MLKLILILLLLIIYQFHLYSAAYSDVASEALAEDHDTSEQMSV